MRAYVLFATTAAAFLFSNAAALGISPSRIHDFRGHSHHIQYHPEDNNTASVEEKYMKSAIVDHSAPVSKFRHWSQRYFINKELWGGRGFPVFLYIGGEGPLTASVITERNYIYTAAKKHRALLVALEHRFYGKSYPTSDMSNDNLRLLTSEQALPDLARFHHFLGTTLPTIDSSWVAFGGSYPGSLAAWFKLKYPSLVVGSIASSAPIKAQEDFSSYMEVVGNGYRYFGGAECYNAIEAAMSALHEAVVLHPSLIKSLFNPCSGPITNDLDASVFESTIMGYFQDISQYNKLRQNEMTVTDVCHHFTTSDGDDDILKKLASFAKMNRKAGVECTDSKFDDAGVNSTIGALSVVNFDGESSGRQWFYQTCNEFGYFQSAESRHSPFFPLKTVTQERMATEVCKRVFDIKTSPAILSTNLNYGALEITVANVTFPSGTIDPWHVLAVQNSTKLSLPGLSVPVFIEGTAHCADMRAPAESDLPAMKWAHAKIAAQLEYYLHSKKRSRTFWKKANSVVMAD